MICAHFVLLDGCAEDFLKATSEMESHGKQGWN
jgi:hypothetical protein